MTRQPSPRAVARTHRFWSRVCSFHKHPCVALGGKIAERGPTAWAMYARHDDGEPWPDAANEHKIGLVTV